MVSMVNIGIFSHLLGGLMRFFSPAQVRVPKSRWNSAKLGGTGCLGDRPSTPAAPKGSKNSGGESFYSYARSSSLYIHYIVIYNYNPILILYIFKTMQGLPGQPLEPTTSLKKPVEPVTTGLTGWTLPSLERVYRSA